MERRSFIKSSCQACLLGFVGSAIVSELSGCSPAYPVFKTEVVNKELRIPLAIFDTVPTQIIHPKKWEYDIVVEKKDNAYSALLLKCTHQPNELMPIGNNGYQCSRHGSRFDKEGKVKKGPAEKSLKKYETFIDNKELVIKV